MTSRKPPASPAHVHGPDCDHDPAPIGAHGHSHVHGPDCDHDHGHGGETYVRAEPKIQRNDPCPCGSGKKYKKCHDPNG
ncbi:MAG: SEC-C metal-binding domain-containing protein [Myxococcota bacterium]